MFISGSTIFSEILAKDNDKPNTPNSDVHYSIIGGNERGKFSLEDTNPASLLLRNPLDYDAGDTHFVLTILASVRVYDLKKKISLAHHMKKTRLRTFLVNVLCSHNGI